MASLQKTYSGDLTASISDYLWNEFQDARRLADDQRGRAEYEGKKWGVDPMLRRGEFFGQALKYKMTPNPMGLLGKRFQKEPFGPASMRDYISKGQSTPFASPINPKPTSSAMMARFSKRPFPNVALPGGDQAPTTTNPVSNTPLVSGPTISSTRNKQKAVVVRDEKLGTFMSAVAFSLSASMVGMGKKMDDADEGIIQVKDALAGTIKRLEYSSDTLGDKLDAIIGALRDNNNIVDDEIQGKKVAAEAAEMREEKRDYEGEVIQKVGEDREEFEARDARDEQEDRERIPDPWEDAPKLAKGGIVDGPASGYPAILHDREMVIPMNNNAFIDGQERVSPKTSIVQNFQMGTDRPKDPSFEQFPDGFLKSAVAAEAPETPDLDDAIADVGKAVEFVPKAAGIVTMNMLGKTLAGQKEFAGDVVGPLRDILTPLSAFGVGNSITNNLIRSISVAEKTEARKEEQDSMINRDQKQRAWWDFLGWAGTGNSSEDNDLSDRGTGKPGTGGTSGIGVKGTGGGNLSNITSSVSNAYNGISNWWNKGRNARVPNENTARWRGQDGLMADDAKQLTRTNKAFKSGASGVEGWRPWKAFTPKMVKTGPTPAVRQAFERPVRAMGGMGSVRGGVVTSLINSILGPMSYDAGAYVGKEIRKYLQEQIKNNLSSPQSRGATTDYINMESFENQSSKINNYNEQQAQLTAINTTPEVVEKEPALQLIANNPHMDLGPFFNDPYNRG